MSDETVWQYRLENREDQANWADVTDGLSDTISAWYAHDQLKVTFRKKPEFVEGWYRVCDPPAWSRPNVNNVIYCIAPPWETAEICTDPEQWERMREPEIWTLDDDK